MPSEPDNRMDDLLKTYAKKRRDEAGAPMEMHPATRKLLQAEVAKLRPKAPYRKESWFSVLLAFWPRYALAVAVFVILGVGAWSFFRFEEQPSQMALLDAERSGPQPENAEKLAAAPATAVSDTKKENGGRPFQEAIGGERDAVRRMANGPVAAEQPVLLREESSVRSRSVADESKPKLTAVELVAKDALNLEAKRLSLAPPASTPAPVIAPVAPAEKPGSRSLAAAGAPDKRKLNESNEPSTAAGRNIAFNYAQTPNQPPAAANEPALRSLNRDSTLSDSSDAKSRLDALNVGNSVTLQLADAPVAYNDGFTPLANSRAQELFGLNITNSAGGRLGQGQNLTLNGGAAPFDNYSTLPQLQANSANANAQNSRFYRATESETLARQNSFSPAPQSPAASDLSRNAGESGAARFSSQLGAVTQTSQGATASRSRFSQVPSNVRAPSPRPTSTAVAQVLAEFEFEQTGNQVRVVDADGSVYDGQIIEDVVKADAAKVAELGKAAPQRTVTTEGENAGAWNFRASGTNRTLQQPVTINGVLYATSTNRGGQAVAPPRGIQQRTQQTAQQSAIAGQLPVQRIQGRVQVGNGGETQLDALRRGN